MRCEWVASVCVSCGIDIETGITRRTMKLPGPELYIMRVVYSRWAVLDDHMVDGVRGADEFHLYIKNLNEMVRTMKLLGSGAFPMRVMYSRGAVLKRRPRRLGEVCPKLRGDYNHVLQTVTKRDACYRTEEYSEEHVVERFYNPNISGSCVSRPIEIYPIAHPPH